MIHPPHKVCVWPANLLVPGVGLVLAGNILLGALVAVVWGLAAGGAVTGLIWPAVIGGGLRLGLWVTAAALYVAMQAALYVRLRAIARNQADPGRDERFKEVLKAYLQGRYVEAEAACRALLRQDPDDADAMLQLGTIARRRGRLAAARRFFRRARYLDDQGKWDGEIGRELASLEVAAASGRGRRR
jgi:tetratricopeptide (TPR) repeat protein